MTREQLIAHYERNLKKVEGAYAPGKCLNRALAEDYIAYARKQLKEVRNGREW